MPETVQPASPSPRRRRWDGFRRIAAWAGLVEAVAVVVVILTVGGRLTGEGEGQDPATTWTIILLLSSPAVFAGLVSGSRFVSLYAGYAERLEPTASLSEVDAAQGATSARSVIGDGLWGSLIGGLAGSIPATLGLAQLFGALAVIVLPLFALVIGIAWFTGWVAGAVASLLLSTAIGIALGVRRRPDRGRRLPWVLVAILLPLLLIAVVVPAVGVRFADGRVDVWSGILAVAGFPVEGVEFLFGDPVLILMRIVIWLVVLLLAVLVVIGTPALLQRWSDRSA